MSTKIFNLVLLTTLFLAYGTNKLSASSHQNSNAAEQPTGSKPIASQNKNDVPPPTSSESDEEEWKKEARKKMARYDRLEKLEKKENGKVRPRTSVQ